MPAELLPFPAKRKPIKSTKHATESFFETEVAATEVESSRCRAQKAFDYLINAYRKTWKRVSEVMALIERPANLLKSMWKKVVTSKRRTIIAKLDPAEAQFRLEKAQIALRNAKAE